MSPNRIIYHTSVFADGPGGGNPCPVVINSCDLTPQQGISLAAEFGAETVIISEPKESDYDYEIHYFVPKHEMEMCVHGTIAAITVLKEIGRLTITPVRIETALGAISAEWFQRANQLEVTVNQFPPEFSSRNPTPAEVCSVLRIPLDAIQTGTGPIVSISSSRHKLLVPLSSNDLLNQLDPDFEVLWRLCEHYNTTGLYPFASTDDGISDEYSARHFPNMTGYNEDPATGVAACALGAYLATYQSKKEGWQTFQICQGYAIARPSRMIVGVYTQKGNINQICIAGNAIIHNQTRAHVASGVQSDGV
jgi:PhzF family phenazine biosynthesis protein